jgi:hypothetical protein
MYKYFKLINNKEHIMKKGSFILLCIAIVLTLSVIACSRDGEKTDKDNSIPDTELIALFNKNSNTLDGAYAEKYAFDLYDAYKHTDYKKYINVLSNYEKSNVKHIIKLLVEEAISDDGKAAVEEYTSIFNKLHDDKDITEMEKYIVLEMYTYVLYLQLP